MRKSLIIFCVLFLSTIGRAQDIITVDDIRYLLDEETRTASVKGCGGWTSAITIPQTIEARGQEYAVTSIADSAFISSWSLSGVDIAPSITRIGSYAFKDCSRLTFADIPASVTVIGEFAFKGCSAMDKFVVAEDNRYYCTDESGVLYNKSKTLLIQCPMNLTGEFNAPLEVREVAPYAFYKCKNIWRIILYNKVEVIGEHAFDKNENLEDITFGTGLLQIGDYALDNCQKLRHIYCQAANPPAASDLTFDYDWIEYSKLHVPSASVNTYKKTRPWNWTEEVVSLTNREIEVGIAPLEHADEPMARYTLDGRKATTGMRGIQIIHSSNGAKKVVRD